MFPPLLVVRFGLEFITSNPQNHVYDPSTVMAGLMELVPSYPSIVARSPAYWRTMMGLDEVPLRLLVKWPV